MQCFFQKLNQPINSKINYFISYTKNLLWYVYLCSEIFVYNESFKFNTSLDSCSYSLRLRLSSKYK